MKGEQYLQPAVSLSLLIAGLAKQSDPIGDIREHPGHYVFTGSNKSSLDSQYVMDSATRRLYIDSSFNDIVDVVVDEQNISFNFRPGTFTERVSGGLNYTFPLNGPYQFASHALEGTFFHFTLADGTDSLYFDYRFVSSGNSSFLYKVIKFRGKRDQ